VREQQFEVSGPSVRLRGRGAEIMGLAFHELVTNSLKFGALAAAGARTQISWEIHRKEKDSWLRFRWIETQAPSLSQDTPRRGFGRELIEQTLPYELAARTQFELTQGGLLCTIDLPLNARTANPYTCSNVSSLGECRMKPTTQRRSIDLSGITVLVAEDNYYPDVGRAADRSHSWAQLQVTPQCGDAGHAQCRQHRRCGPDHSPVGAATANHCRVHRAYGARSHRDGRDALLAHAAAAYLDCARLDLDRLRLAGAFFMLFTSLSRDPRLIAHVARWVVIADWVFTTPTVILQPATGLYLVHLAGLPMSSRWILWSMVLYSIAIASWLPVVWLQLQMRNLAVAASAELPSKYWTYLRWWTGLGCVAFIAFLSVFYFMVVKPT
jgi:uncharacterized membrane protein